MSKQSFLPQELKVPVSFVYGKNDWMQPSAGQRVAAATVSARGRLSPYDCKVRLPVRSSVVCACTQASGWQACCFSLPCTFLELHDYTTTLSEPIVAAAIACACGCMSRYDRKVPVSCSLLVCAGIQGMPNFGAGPMLRN